MLSDEVTKELFVDTSLIDHLFTSQSGCLDAMGFTYGGVPKGAPQFNSFEKHRLSLIEREIVTQPEVDTHGTKPGNGDFDIGEGKLLDHVEYVESMDVIY